MTDISDHPKIPLLLMFDDEDGGAKSCEVFWCCMLNMQSCLHGSQGSDEDFISKIFPIKLNTSQEGGGGSSLHLPNCYYHCHKGPFINDVITRGGGGE